MNRREFLAGTAVAGLALAARANAASGKAEIKKACQLGMLPKELSDKDKFALAKKCGFEGIEAVPMDDLGAAAKLGEAARAAGVPIHSIVFGGWKEPLSDPDPAVRKAGVAGMEVALRSAKAMGADTVLLVPAVVTEQVRYVEAFERSTAEIAKLLPIAEEVGVVIAVENVWNKFLLSPVEFRDYVDSFKSPWLRAYFDVGNVVIHGYPEDWIRTLGERTVKLHLKDFRRKDYAWTNLRDGDVNWPEVRKALDEVGFKGYATTELKGGDEAYLTEVAKRCDLIIAGE